ncbi:MAG: GspH/FimT family pseudopilin [Betaproteobacteria bacterium]
MTAIRRISPRPSGVTLLELMIVISIMAFAVAIVLPMLGSGASTAELKGAARELASGLRYARGQAIVQRGEAFLVLDIDARTFRIPPDAKVHRLPDKIGIKLFTAQRDLVNEKVGAIRFYPDGGSNGGRITLAAGERKFDVDVDWLTGRVAILD